MRRSSLALAAVALATLALVATACGSSSSSGSGSSATTAAASDDPLLGSWTLSGYTADGKETAAAASPAGIELAADGTFAGTTGCNQLSGTWKGTADGAFTITPGPMTQMACADPFVQAQETALTTGLPKVASVIVTSEALTMSDSSGAELFTWARATDELVGSYTVTGINNGKEAVVGTAETSKANITFAADGTVSGNTGCNSFSGSYTLDGSSLEIDPDVAATMMACEDASQQVETQFLNALSQVSTWERSGDTVTLRDPAGATQLTLQASS